MTDEEINYLSNYGSCAMDECLCVRGAHPHWPGAWGGLACEHWRPIGARSFDELMRIAREKYKQTVEVCGND